VKIVKRLRFVAYRADEFIVFVYAGQWWSSNFNATSLDLSVWTGRCRISRDSQRTGDNCCDNFSLLIRGKMKIIN
jgi:hypothetical protein